MQMSKNVNNDVGKNPPIASFHVLYINIELASWGKMKAQIEDTVKTCMWEPSGLEPAETLVYYVFLVINL